jgi:hypothetical protein
MNKLLNKSRRLNKYIKGGMIRDGSIQHLRNKQSGGKKSKKNEKLTNQVEKLSKQVEILTKQVEILTKQVEKGAKVKTSDEVKQIHSKNINRWFETTFKK